MTVTESYKRVVYFISDRTAITAQTLGQSLLTQFNNIQFEQVCLPFVDTPEKARDAVGKINEATEVTGLRPIVFSTLINPEIRTIIMSSVGLNLDFFETFIGRLEAELSTASSQIIGLYHGMANGTNYDVRIDAVNYALSTDDGILTKHYDKADIILIGVSRTGKTPASLYMSLQFGIYVANYPLTDENFVSKYTKLPAVLSPYRHKLYGLTIDSDRLHEIRSQRRPNSRYASVKQCQLEVSIAELMYVSEKIPYLNITAMSVEEIAAIILNECKLKRRLF